MILRLPLPIARAFLDWSGKARRSYVKPPLYVPKPQRFADWHSLDSRSLAESGPHYRHEWRRRTLPLYGKQPSVTSSALVEVPPWLRFKFVDETPDDFPEIMPLISLRPIGHRGDTRYPALNQGTYLLQSRALRPDRDERHRRRMDQKPGVKYYRRGLRLYNRTVGTASEYMEIHDAFRNSQGDPAKLLTALAINEGIDRLYGARADLYNRVHRSGYWPFPIGIQAMSRLWR